MEFSQWFGYQLRSTLEGFVWAVGHLAGERWYELPPSPLGEWSAAEHVYHMLNYEKRLALPTMYQWLCETPKIKREEALKREIPPVLQMLEDFKQVRQTEIDLLPKFDEANWNSFQITEVWGEVSLSWLVSKTYQHTLDHTHNILGLSLFWDRVIARMAHESDR